jgi:hypothetical protein
LQSALAPAGEVLPVRSNQPLTQPMEFKFATEGRSARKSSAAPASAAMSSVKKSGRKPGSPPLRKKVLLV